MALSELEIKRIEKAMAEYKAKHRPAVHISSMLVILPYLGSSGILLDF